MEEAEEMRCRNEECRKVSRSPKAKNWQDYQLCYRCYCKIILKTLPTKGTGGTYLKEPNYADLATASEIQEKPRKLVKS